MSDRIIATARLSCDAAARAAPAPGSAFTWENLHLLVSDARSMARRLLRCEAGRRSLQTTALLLSGFRRQKLHDQQWCEVRWADRERFLAAMYRAMERALIDHGRRRAARKRRALEQVTVDELTPGELLRLAQFQPHELEQAFDQSPEVIEALTEALALLERNHPDWASVARHRYYGALTIEQTARMMGVAERTVRRHWEKARILLHDEILRILRERGVEQ